VRGSSFLRFAIAGEAGLLLLAWVVGRWLGIEPLDRLHLVPETLALGVVASVPLLLGLRWTLTTRSKSVRRLVSLVEAQLGPVLASRSWAELAGLAMLAGTAEEILFRGVIQVGLAQVLPQGLALLLASVAFGLAHFVTPLYALLAGLASVYLGALFWARGDLLAPIVAHALYDAVALMYLVRRYRATQQERG
jgi:uncharacterized protein